MKNFINKCYNKHPFTAGFSITFISLYSLFIRPHNIVLKEKEKYLELKKMELLQEEQKTDIILSYVITKNDFKGVKIDDLDIDLLGQDDTIDNGL